MSKERSKEKSSGAFNRPVHISETLAVIVGHGPMPRTQVPQKLWEYIKKHQLQDPKNKRNINPDKKLAEVFGSSATISMFEMTRKIAPHLKEKQTVSR